MVRLYLPIGRGLLFGSLSFVLFGVASSVLAFAQEQFPYVAYVIHDDAYVRSGPGQRYYPTQQLSQGFAVEVYRHDGDGWCAIRPPEGSFSWAAAHDVRIVGENAAEVTAEHAVTRVGSTLSPARTAVQVLLERGERVALMPGTSADPDWLRVVAPAGEFRWIAARDLGRQAPLEVNPPTAPTNAWSSSQSGGAAAQSNTPPVASEPNAFDHLLQSGATAPAPIGLPAARVDIVAGSPAELQLAQFQGQTTGLAAPGLMEPTTSASESTVPRIRLEGATPPAQTYTQPEIPDRVREIELRLSQVVSDPPPQWRLDTLQVEVHTLLAQTQDTLLRTQLRDLSDRIARFQQIHDGHDRIVSTTEPPIMEDALPELGPPPDPVREIVQDVRERVREDFAEPRKKSAGKSLDEPLYDAVGLLKPVVSRRENAPQYALVDGQGDVVSFVTPTPDLNLQPYVGRRVGVNGSRGFMNEFRRAIVTAGRVTPIDGTIRR